MNTDRISIGSNYDQFKSIMPARQYPLLAKTNFPENINSSSTDRFTAMHQIISLGLGIGILPDYLGDSDLNLVPLFTLPEKINKDVWLLTIQIYVR